MAMLNNQMVSFNKGGPITIRSHRETGSILANCDLLCRFGGDKTSGLKLIETPTLEYDHHGKMNLKRFKQRPFHLTPESRRGCLS